MGHDPPIPFLSLLPSFFLSSLPKTLDMSLHSSFNMQEMIRSGNKGITGTLAANAGDVRLQAAVGDASFGNGPTVDFTGLSLSLEKPGSFVLDFNVPTKNACFQFMNTVNVLEKQLNWTYTHSRNQNRIVLDATLILDPSNKIYGSSELRSRNRKLKYSYVHNGGTIVEPCYDFGKNAWDLVVSHSFFSGDIVKASYNTMSKNLGLSWSWRPFQDREDTFKVLATSSLAEGRLHWPTFSYESSWSWTFHI